MSILKDKIKHDPANYFAEPCFIPMPPYKSDIMVSIVI